VHATANDKFIHVNSELTDDFHAKTQLLSVTVSDRDRDIDIAKLKQGSIYLDYTNIPRYTLTDWPSLIYEVGLQYAWKSSKRWQRFFDYIYSKNIPLTVATDYEQYIQHLTENAAHYDIYLGLTTIYLNPQTDDPEANVQFGIYKQPKLVIDFNQGMLADLFTEYHGNTEFRDSNTLATARLKGLVIAGVVDGDFAWDDDDNDAVVIKNSATQGSKILYLPNDLIIAKFAKIQANEHKTGLKIIDENAVIVGNIHNYGSITAGTAVEIGAEDKKFPLLIENLGKNALPNNGEMQKSNFYNSGVIKAYKHNGIAFKVIGSSDIIIEDLHYVTDYFNLYNNEEGEISGKLQGNELIAFNVINSGKIEIPAEDNAIQVYDYTGNAKSKLIIEFDDNFGDIPEDTTVINIASEAKLNLDSQIIIAKADNAKIDSSSTQQKINLIKASKLLIQKDDSEPVTFDKNPSNMLCTQAFIEDGKKFVIVADPAIDKTQTQLKASFKIIEIEKNAPDIIPLTAIQHEIAKSTSVAKLIRPNKIIKAGETPRVHKVIEASKLTPAHKSIEYMTFNKHTSTTYYKKLISKIKHEGTIKKLQVITTSNVLANKHGSFVSTKSIDIQKIVTVADVINADTEISLVDPSLSNQITFEYLDNIKNSRNQKAATYDLKDATLYLGLTAYKKLHSHQYELGLFDYISKDKYPAFEFDLGYPDGFNKVAMFNNNINLKNIIVTSVLDSTSSQEAALLIANSSNIDKSLNLSKGLIIANTGKLIASNKNDSQAALVIASNKEKSTYDAMHTTGNENLITKPLLSGGIYNYGLISGNIAVNIGDHGKFFPLKVDNDSAFLDNYGQIISNNIAVKISGEKTDFTTKFTLTNQQQGIIEGAIQIEKNFASNGIEFNVVNYGKIKIPAENNSVCVNNYTNIKASSLIIEFKDDNINPNDAILNIGEHADFQSDSKVVFDFEYYDVNLDEKDIIDLPLLYTNTFSGNKDKLFFIRPVINDYEYILYNVMVKKDTDGSHDKLELNIISKEVFDLEQNPEIINSLPRSDITVTNIANKIKTLKMLAKKNQTDKEQQTKKIHDALLKTHTVHHALENSKSPEEYADVILPDNSSPAQLSNQKIFDRVTSQVQARVMNRNIYSKYYYLQKSATNINVNDYANNAEMWGSVSYHAWNEKAPNSLKNKIKNYLFIIGCDYEIANDDIIGVSYGLAHTNFMTHIKDTNVTKIKDIITTQSVSIYSRFNLNLIDGIASLSYNASNHNIEIQDNKKPKFKSTAYSFNAGVVYTTSYYNLNLDLSGLIGLVSVNVGEHEGPYYEPNTNYPVKTVQQSDRLTNISIGFNIYNKVYLNETIFFDYRCGVSYQFRSGPKVNQTNSNLINSHIKTSHLPNKHSINLNILTKLFLNEHAAIELTLDSTIEKDSFEYGAAFAFRYLF
jgi:hypothetical protein